MNNILHVDMSCIIVCIFHAQYMFLNSEFGENYIGFFYPEMFFFFFYTVIAEKIQVVIKEDLFPLTWGTKYLKTFLIINKRW